jgi:hypothetical protein
VESDGAADWSDLGGVPDHGGRPPQYLLAHDGAMALGDRIAAPLGERREALQAARKKAESCRRSFPGAVVPGLL